MATGTLSNGSGNKKMMQRKAASQDYIPAHTDLRYSVLVHREESWRPQFGQVCITYHVSLRTCFYRFSFLLLFVCYCLFENNKNLKFFVHFSVTEAAIPGSVESTSVGLNSGGFCHGF